MSGRLAGRIAIITGGSRGIGQAIATEFVEEGATVVISSRKQEALDEVAGTINAEDRSGRAIGRACHTGKPEQVRGLVDWVEAEVGLPTIVVNNAGTNPYFGPMLETPDWAWAKTLEVNLTGYFLMAQAVCRRLRDTNTPGSIINVASVLGLGAARLQGVYGISKAGIVSMTKTLAFELGAANIRVNAIAPGLIDTKFSAVLMNTPEILEEFTGKTALGRHGLPSEVSSAAVWLACDESSYVTGQTIAVDGGYTAMT